jgi:hypothetical protein
MQNIKNVMPMTWAVMGFILCLITVFYPIKESSQTLINQATLTLFGASLAASNPSEKKDS